VLPASSARHAEAPWQKPVLPTGGSPVGHVMQMPAVVVMIAPLVLHDTMVPTTTLPQHTLERRSQLTLPHCCGW
jgi:hypothetical protein